MTVGDRDDGEWGGTSAPNDLRHPSSGTGLSLDLGRQLTDYYDFERTPSNVPARLAVPAAEWAC